MLPYFTINPLDDKLLYGLFSIANYLPGTFHFTKIDISYII
jgi:hypothetical protein